MNGQFPHPSLTPLQAEALTILAEEASEVAIECSKILRMGTDFCRRGRDVKNSSHLAIEFADFYLLFAIVDHLGLVDTTLDFDALVDAKIEKLGQWSNLGPVAREVAGD